MRLALLLLICAACASETPETPPAPAPPTASAAQAFASGRALQARGLFAHTSPIYVACGGEWGMFDESAARYMLTLIDGSLTYIRETATHHAPGSVTPHHGEDDHQAFLERPFLDARDAMRRRLEAKA